MTDIANLILGMDTTGTDKGTESLNRLDAAGKSVGATVDSTTKKVDEMGKAASRGAANYQVFNGSMNDTARIIRNAEKAVQDLAKEQLAAAQAAKELSKSQDQHTFSMNSSLAKMEMMRVAHDAMIGSYTRMGSSMFVLGNATGLTTMLFSAAGVAFLGVAAAAGSFVAAAIMGAKETAEFGKQMLLTGGIAGITKGQFNAMSAEIASSSHSGIGTVKEVMQGLIASGKFTGEALTTTAKTAVDFAHATGESTEDVLKDFEKMSDGVTKWAEKHNEQYHFLTASQYAQITALEEQGKTSEAVAITMQAMDSRLATATENLGYGATAWRFITVEASAFWDVMKGIGRDQTGEEKLKKYQDIINSGGRSREANVDGKNYQSQAEKDVFVKDAQVQIDFINKNIAISERFAEIKKANILIDKEGVAATKEYIAFGNQHLDNIEKLEKAEIKYHATVSKLVAADAKDGSSLAPDASQQIMDLAAIKLDIYGKEKKAVAEKISDYERLMISLRENLAVQELALSSDEKLTSGQKIAAKVMEDLRSGVLKTTQAQAANIAVTLEKIIADEKANEAKNFAIKQADDLVSAGEKELQSLDDQIKKQKEAYEQMGLTKAQIDDLKQTRLLDAAAADTQLASNKRLAAFDEKLIKDMGGPLHDAYIQYANDLDLAAQKKLKLANQQGDIAEKQRIIDAGNEAIKQADRAQKKWEESNRQIGDGLYAAIAKGGDAAIKKMISDLKNWFARLVLSPIISPIAAFGASLMNPGSAMAQGTTGGAFGSTASLMSAGSTLFSGFSSAMTAAGTLGSGLFGSISGGLMGAGVGSGLTSASGLAIGQSISSIVGPALSGAISTGMGAIATALPWIAAAGAVLAIGKAAFSMGDKQMTGQTVSGNLGTQDLSRSVGWSQSGGFARSDRSGTWNYGLSNSTATADGKSYQDTASVSSDSTMLKSLTEGYAAVKTASADYAKALGINADSIATRTDAISFAIGKDAATTQANVVKMFSDIGDKIATDLLGGFGTLAKTSETAAATLTRLSTDFVAVNNVMVLLGKSSYSASVDGVKAAESLVTAFGNIATLQSASASYFDNFYSDAEKLKLHTQLVSDAFASAGQVMPTTRDALRGMIDVAKAMGDNTTYAKLVMLSSSFAAVVPASTAAADAIAAMAQAASDSAATIANAASKAAAVANENYGLNTQLLTLQGNTVELRKRELALIDPSNRALQQLIWTTTDKQAADQAAAAAQAQAAQQAQQAAQQAQQAASAIASAWQSVTDSVFAEVARIRGLIGGNSAQSFAGAQSAFTIGTDQARSGDLEAMKLLPQLSQSLLTLAEQNAGSATELAYIRSMTANSLQDTAMGTSKYGVKLPSFAVGTDFVPHDMVAQIHKGEMIVPAAFNGGGQNDALVKEIKALRQEVSQLRTDNNAQQVSIALNMEKTAKILTKNDTGSGIWTTTTAPA